MQNNITIKRNTIQIVTNSKNFTALSNMVKCPYVKRLRVDIMIKVSKRSILIFDKGKFKTSLYMFGIFCSGYGSEDCSAHICWMG